MIPPPTLKAHKERFDLKSGGLASEKAAEVRLPRVRIPDLQGKNNPVKDMIAVLQRI
jgi:hypothetical protein